MELSNTSSRESYIRRYGATGLSLIKLSAPDGGGQPGDKGSGKVPLEPGWHGWADKPMDEGRIRELADHQGNLGLPIPSGLVVLDADSEEMAESIQRQIDLNNLLYWMQRSGRGAHFVLKSPEGLALTNRVKAHVGGLEFDVRVRGGQIVVEPSIHATGAAYRWETGKAPWDVGRGGLSVIPVDWLKGLAKEQPVVVAGHEVDGEHDLFKGGRNDGLFRMGASMRAKGFDVAAIEKALLEHNAAHCVPPLTRDEVRRIAESQSRYSQGDPLPQRLPEGYAEQGGKILCRLGGYVLEAQGWRLESGLLRVTLKLLRDGAPIALETVKLESGAGRKQFSAQCPEDIRVSVDAELLRLTEHIRRKMAESKQTTDEPPVPPMNDADKAEALALAENPRMVDELLRDIEELGFAGEEENKIYLYLAYTSRKQDNPINTTVKGESSSGKNFETESVAEFIPPEDVLKLTGTTAKALYYRDRPLKHKLVMIAERVGSEESDYSIRSLQSEKQIVLMTCQKNAEGRIETVEKKVEGPAAFVETTTRAHLHPENETRNFEIYVDDSEAQTDSIFEAQNRRHLDPVTPSRKDRLVKRWRNLQRILEPIPVFIPFVRAITFPNTPVRVRRDRLRFMALIEASAFIHQRQRERREVNGIIHTVASLEDYAMARRLAEPILQQVLCGATPKCEKLVESARNLSIDERHEDITLEALEVALGWSHATVKKYAREAANLGCLRVTESGGRGAGNARKYAYVKDVDEVRINMPEPEEIWRRSCPAPAPSGAISDIYENDARNEAA